MSDRKSPQRKQNFQVVLTILAVVSVLAYLSRLPGVPAGEAANLATQFQFAWEEIPQPPTPAGGVVFPVNKTAQHMAFYFYQVGESAALGDLDGDGLPNDLCLTDVQTKSAMVRPVPHTGERYAPFTLEFGKLLDRVTQYPSVCRIADINEDGLSDLFIAFYGRPPILLLRNAALSATDKGGLSMQAFTVAELVPNLDQRWWTATATFADIDGDGQQDIIVGNYYPDDAELFDANSSRPFEMNRDFSRARNGGKNRIFLYVNSTTGATPSAMYRDAGDVFPDHGAYAWTLAVGAADLDRDGLSDLYIANDFGPDQLLWNQSQPGRVKFLELKGEKGFFRSASMAVGHDSFKGMSIDFGDVNHDGTFDMTVSNIGSPFALQEAHFLWTSTGQNERIKSGFAPWVNRSAETGVAHSAWGWDSRFEDFNNDGVLELVQATGLVKGTANRWPDLSQVGAGNDAFVKYQSCWPEFLMGSAEVDGSYPNPFWVLSNNGLYADLSTTLFPGLTPATRGIAIADVDGDGYPEMVYANFWERSVYIKNKTSGNSFLGLHLLLPAANTDNGAKPITATTVHDGHPRWREGTPAIGAFVEVDTPGTPSQIRQVDGGNGHSGQRSPQVLIGLGQTTATQIPVRITWRDLHGSLHHDALSLTPGYHTVVLAAQGVTP